MIWVDKELDADMKAIKQTEFFGRLKNPAVSIVACESLVLKVIVIFSRKYNSLIKDGELWRSKS